MRKKKTSKFESAKADPLLRQAPGIQFDNIEAADIIELTDAQKATAFLSRYLETEHPISRFHSYFEASVKGEAWEMKELKRFYSQLVIPGKWSEEKFIAIANGIYEDNQLMTAVVLDARGRLFDNGSLKPKEKPGQSRRRGRI